jgi:putative endonuclease
MIPMPNTQGSFTYVYLLTSIADPDRHYTGLTDNLPSRLTAHNAGQCSHTAKYRPWQIETAISFRSREKAAAFEKYLKTGSGRAFARRHF